MMLVMLIGRNRGLPDSSEALFSRSTFTANQTTSGKMMMMLWNLKGFEVPPADYQQRLDAILKAYPLPVSK